MKRQLIGILAFLPFSILIASCSSEEIVEKNEAALPLVKLSKIEKKDFKHEIRIQGSVETDKDILLGAEMGGLITAVNVKEGQKVSAGQIIAVVDASILASNYEEMKTQLEYAEYMYNKQKELNKRGVGSEFDLETAKNQVASLKASMNSLNTQRGKAVIKAPFAGIIDAVYAKIGQMAGPQAPIVRLVNNSNVDIVATLSEKHLPNVKVGTPIAVRLPNYSDTVFNLTITNVGNYIEETNRTFRIMSSIKNNTLLLPNMLTEISVTDLEVKDGLVIPAISISKDQNNNDYIYIAKQTPKGLKAVKVNIEVINKFDGEALIVSDKVSAGDNVIVEGARGIAENDIVRTK